jgi:hypothetical protein
MIPRVLSLALVFLFASSALAQKLSPADLAIRSRAILAKHCTECHGDKPTRSELQVLDHSHWKKERSVPLVRPKDPTASQVLDLIEEGSMPPGKHPKLRAEEVAVIRDWVASGAAAYPVRFDDEFAHAKILADVQKYEPDDTASFRYLSLHHLAADGSNADLQKARTEFLTAVMSVLRAGAEVQPIDPTETIFKIDLQTAGWHHLLFKKIDKKGLDGGPADGNLFDVVLLEYPHAVIPENSPAYEKLGAAFLKPARQVRPIAFVRGDWFAEITTTSPLADDLSELIGRIEVVVPPGLLRPKPASTKKPASVPGAIGALDAWHGSDPNGPSSVKGLKVGILDFTKKQPRSRFQPDDRFWLRVSADEPMYFQYIWVNSIGEINTPGEVRSYDPTDGPKDIVLPLEGGLNDELGKERVIVFAAPREFKPAEGWRARHETKTIERFIHPLLPLKPKGEGYVPDIESAKVSRLTVTIEIVKSGK